jgi:hypothetical protein
VDARVTGAELEFREFFAAEYGRLRGLGYLLTSDWAQAEELAQDALVRTYRAWSRVRRSERPGAYARKVLVNRHRSLLRRAAVEARHLAGRRSEEAVQAALGEDGLVLWSAVRRLPPPAAPARPAPTTGSSASAPAGPGEWRPRAHLALPCCSPWSRRCRVSGGAAMTATRHPPSGRHPRPAAGLRGRRDLPTLRHLPSAPGVPGNGAGRLAVQHLLPAHPLPLPAGAQAVAPGRRVAVDQLVRWRRPVRFRGGEVGRTNQPSGGLLVPSTRPACVDPSRPTRLKNVEWGE